jgi:hypothetical protein
MKDKNYGDSIWEPIVTQVSLIGNIDKNFDDFFERGGVNIAFLEDVNDKLSEEQFDVLVNYLEDKLKGRGNGYKWVSVPCEINKKDVTDKPVAKDLLPYRKDLEKSCAIRLNIPYDLILSENSNYASSKTAMQQMNLYLISPELGRLLKQIKYLFTGVAGIEGLEFNSISINDNGEMSEVATKYA